MIQLDDSDEEYYGVARMDREHAKHLSLLNDLKAAVRSGAPDDLVYALLAQLVKETDLHFISEQLAMKLNAYEAYEAHFLEHQRLRTAVYELKDNLSSGTETDKQTLIEALRGWLIVHIQTADQMLSEHLRSRAIQPEI